MALNLSMYLFKTGSHEDQTGLKLSTQPRQTLDFLSSSSACWVLRRWACAIMPRGCGAEHWTQGLLVYQSSCSRFCLRLVLWEYSKIPVSTKAKGNVLTDRHKERAVILPSGSTLLSALRALNGCGIGVGVWVRVRKPEGPTTQTTLQMLNSRMCELWNKWPDTVT